MKKTLFPLIERPSGITYEHTLVERLPLDIIIAAAEINLFVDSYHEINLCVYYNARTPNTYDFDNKYYFYRTDGRACLSFYWNLGKSKKYRILERYDNLEAALSSEYAEYFKTMKERIDERVAEKKASLEQEKKDAFKFSSYHQHDLPGNKGSQFIFPCEKTKEFVRIIVNPKKDKWQLITCKEDYEDVFGFIPDFDKLDEKLLHLQTYHDELDVKNLDISSPYYSIVETVKSHFEEHKIIIDHDINPDKIEYMEYISSHFNLMEMKSELCDKIKICKNGDIIQTIYSKEKEVIKNTISSNKVKSFYKDISKFLTSGPLKQEVFYDDSSADLFIHFTDGHKEKYNRGLTRNDNWIGNIVYKFLNKNFRNEEN